VLLIGKIVIVCVRLVLVLVPLLPLLLAWTVLTRRNLWAGSGAVTVKLPLLITTGSCLLYFLTLLSVFLPAAGAHYSDKKFLMIVTTFGVSIAMVPLSLMGKRPFSCLLGIAAGAISLVWLYLWAMSAVA